MITEGDKASLRMERVTVREIARQVAKEAGVKPAVIFGPSRKQKDFRLRALVCYIARRHGMSYPRIGMALALVMATGNNLEVVGDLGRRTLVCRIDTGKERPDQEAHGFSPVDEAMRMRPRLVAAALTVLRAYVTAGKPQPLTPMGSFEDWNLVREALVWLGEEDPTVTRERVIADDPRKGALAELLELWHDALGGAAVTLAEISEEAGRNSRGRVFDLRQALIDRTLKQTFNARSIGRYLAGHKDRLVGGRVLRCIDDPSGVKRYRVSDSSGGEPQDSPF